MRRLDSNQWLTLALGLVMAPLACSESGDGGGTSSGGAGAATAGGTAASTGGGAATGGKTSVSGGMASGGKASSGGRSSGSGGSKGGSGGVAGSSGADGGGGSSAEPSGAGGGNADGELPAGWLFTKGNKVHVSDGKGAGPVWVGRGVNIDDIYLCGYNYTLWMPSPGAELKKLVATTMKEWKPTFFRLSLSMASTPTVSSWLSEPEQYKTPMTEVIDSIGTYPNTYVLVVLRSDASMIGHFSSGPEPTGIPSDAKTTPDAAKFPKGTDEVYIALVNSFAHAPHVLFGVTNEPGGNQQATDTLRKAMAHAVSVIRAEEDRLGVPHHVVAVQGQSWTSDVGFYDTQPLPYDNVVYEVHGYPPTKYGFANIPTIVGEYGSIDAASAPALFADFEAKQIPNLAWDLEPYSNCAPDLVEVNQSSTNLVPNAYGKLVQAYLLEHAK